MSPTCPFVYIHRYTTYNTIYIYTYANISDFFYEHRKSNRYPCIHTLIISIHLSILSFFFGGSCNFSVKLPRPLDARPGGDLDLELDLIDSKGELLGKLPGQQLGWWMVRLGRCGLADFCRPMDFFFGGYIFSVKFCWFVAFFEVGRLLFVGV